MNYQIKTILPQSYKKIKEDLNQKELGKNFNADMRLKYAKELFYNLNLLLKRVDYLKSSIYGENNQDQMVEDEADDEEVKK